MQRSISLKSPKEAGGKISQSCHIYLYADRCVSIKKLLINTNKRVPVVNFLGFRDFPGSGKFHATLEVTNQFTNFHIYFASHFRFF